MRILIVDDEADLASALAERLDLRGIAADWATTAEQALAMAAETSHDLAVLDVRMPGVGGVELQARLKAIRPQMKFIFLTGYGSEQDFKAVADRVGEECYLVKPIDIEVLVEHMHKLLHDEGGGHETD